MGAWLNDAHTLAVEADPAGVPKQLSATKGLPHGGPFLLETRKGR